MSISSGSVIHVSVAHDEENFRVFHREIFSLIKNNITVFYICPNTKNGFRNGVNYKGFKAPKLKLIRPFLTSFIIWKILLEIKSKEIIHIHSIELIPLGIIFKLLGYKLIYEAHDNLPAQIYTKDWIPKYLKFIISNSTKFIEYLADRFFDSIIIVEPTNSERFDNKLAVVIRNYPIEREFEDVNNTNYLERENNLVYIGHISEERGIIDYIKLLERIPEKYNVRLQLAGNFAPKTLEHKLSKMVGWSKVDYHGYIDRNKALEIYRNSKIGLLILHDNPKYRKSDPVKLFEYLASGIPFIMSDFEVWRGLLLNSEVCKIVQPSDINQAEKALLEILDDPMKSLEMGNTARDLYLTEYRWSDEEQKYTKLISQLLE